MTTFYRQHSTRNHVASLVFVENAFSELQENGERVSRDTVTVHSEQHQKLAQGVALSHACLTSVIEILIQSTEALYKQ